MSSERCWSLTIELRGSFEADESGGSQYCFKALCVREQITPTDERVDSSNSRWVGDEDVGGTDTSHNQSGTRRSGSRRSNSGLSLFAMLLMEL
jgi:hypothetical protein